MKVENNGYFTAFLYKRNGADTIKKLSTVQRIQIDYEEITSFGDLEEKLRGGFPELRSPWSKFTIFWGNEENDWISLTDESELLSAIKRTNGSICQLHVITKPKGMSSMLKTFINIY